MDTSAKTEVTKDNVDNKEPAPEVEKVTEVSPFHHATSQTQYFRQ